MRQQLLVLVTVLAACTGTEQAAGGKQAPALDAGRWAVYEMDGAAPLAETTVWVQIDPAGSTVAASAGCNELRAKYTGAPEALTMGPIGATKKLCPEPLMAQERRLIEMLGAATSVTVADDGVLWLSGSQGMLRARQM